MKKSIALNPLNAKSIDRAIKQLDAYKSRLKRKSDELAKRLAEELEAQMSINVSQCSVYIPDGANLASHGDISVIRRKGKENEYVVSANGTDVCFIEFGAGVFYNGDGSNYIGERPDGIAGIGEYGKGCGKRNTWYFSDDDGKFVRTHGTPAQAPVYGSAKYVREMIGKIAKEVFSNE